MGDARPRTTAVFDGLNPEQRRAVEAVRGPVRILAGAGSGKTTTITRRLAHQVASGEFAPPALMAVTFTDKAAREMRVRLEQLGVGAIRARTFHAAALAQLNYFRPGVVRRVVSSKAQILAPLCARLPRPFRFVPVGDFASEIEWAKNQRIGVDDYVTSLGRHEAPAPPDLMQGIYRRYERNRSALGGLDFEDMLEETIRLHEDDEAVRAAFRAKYAAFTVDEYQDVNLLQQTLLERWLGERDDLCVVGDDYQAIYSFTGASADHLLTMPERYPNAQTFRLEANYRSTPEILSLSNRLVPQMDGVRKLLRATNPHGAEPVVRGFRDPDSERAYIVERMRELHERDHVPYEEMAILYRVNARSEDYEDALAEAGIPYRAWDGAFLDRPAARQVLPRLARMDTTDVADAVLDAARDVGYEDEPPGGVGRHEYTRQKDLARLVRLARSFDDGARGMREFVAEIKRRFTSEAEPRAVNLLTLHRAKGLEFDAVFVPAVERGELPHKRAPLDEERRLFYVGLTRAKRYLHVTWVLDAKRQPSMFVTELGYGPAAMTAARGRAEGAVRKGPAAIDDPLVAALKAWRLERSRRDGVPAYVVMHDRTLEEIARRRPRTMVDLGSVSGMGPTKCERYGEEILRVVAAPPAAVRGTKTS